MRITGRHLMAAAAVGMALGLVACERADRRVEQLSIGIGKDSVFQIMGEKPRRNDPVLIRGQYIEAMYFPRQGATDADATQDRNMTPVIAINQKVTGWGWAYWDSVATTNGIEVAPAR
ncbi:MAG: hypothetical protein AB7R55_05410 [Gemmatimonadales bacterium]